MAAPLVGSRRIASWPIIVGPASLHLSLRRWFIRAVHTTTQLEIHAAAPVVRQGRSPDLQNDIADAVLPLDPVARRRTAARPVTEHVLALVGKDLDVAGLDRCLLLGRRRVAEEASSQRVGGSTKTGGARKPLIPLDVFVPHRSRCFRRLYRQILRREPVVSRNSVPPTAGRRARPTPRARQPPPRHRPRSRSAARALAPPALPLGRRARQSPAAPR